GVRGAATAARETRGGPGASDSAGASTVNIGRGPGRKASLARPAGTRQSRHASRSTLARASSPRESSEPSSVRRTRAEPASPQSSSAGGGGRGGRGGGGGRGGRGGRGRGEDGRTSTV